MSRSIAVSIAGTANTSVIDWRLWEQAVTRLAVVRGCELTHSVLVSKADPAKKFQSFRPLKSRRSRREIQRYSIAAVQSPFVTVIQDANLYASRSADGLYIIAKLASREDPKLAAQLILEHVKRCVSKPKGMTAFVLPPSELAANFVRGTNDIRDCKKADVLLYKPGGFLRR